MSLIKNKQNIFRHLIGKGPIVFKGSSMEPLLRDKDSLRFEEITFGQVKNNDLLLIKKNNNLLAHRVIYKTPQYLISKGDNNLESDEKVYPQQIIGRLVFFIRNKQKIYINDIYLLQSTTYLKEIIKINILFNKKGVDFLFLKGLILHLFLIKDHPKRLYNDCDILISKKDFKKVNDILIKLGYKKQTCVLSSKKNSDSGVLSVISYVKIINNFPVVFDIHSELVFLMTQMQDVSPLYPKKKVIQISSDFLNQKRIIQVVSHKFPVLSVNNQVIYLALHFFHHNFRGIFRLEFLHVFIKKNKLNSLSWINIMNIIRQYDFSNYVFPVFVLLKKYFQTPIPISFMKNLSANKNKRFKIIFNVRIFNNQKRGEAGIERFLNIFHFSNSQIYKKILIVFNRQFLSFTFLVLKARLSSFLKNYR